MWIDLPRAESGAQFYVTFIRGILVAVLALVGLGLIALIAASPDKKALKWACGLVALAAYSGGIWSVIGWHFL